MDERETSFAQLYARLLSQLDPDPERSEQALRALQFALSEGASTEKLLPKNHFRP